MANELTVKGFLNFKPATDDGPVEFPGRDQDPLVITADVAAGKRYIRTNHTTAGTAEEALSIGDLANVEWVMLRNTGAFQAYFRPVAAATEYVVLLPGEFAGPARWAGVSAPTIAAPDGNTTVEYVMIES